MEIPATRQFVMRLRLHDIEPNEPIKMFKEEIQDGAPQGKAERCIVGKLVLAEYEGLASEGYVPSERSECEELTTALLDEGVLVVSVPVKKQHQMELHDRQVLLMQCLLVDGNGKAA